MLSLCTISSPHRRERQRLEPKDDQIVPSRKAWVSPSPLPQFTSPKWDSGTKEQAAFFSPLVSPCWFRPIWVCWAHLSLGLWKHLRYISFEPTTVKHSTEEKKTVFPVARDHHPQQGCTHLQSLVLVEFHLCIPSFLIWGLFLFFFFF